MNYLSRVHALYTHLYQRGIRAGRFSYDAGHADSIGINNLSSEWAFFKGPRRRCLLLTLQCIRMNITAPHFGYPGQNGQIEWEVMENLLQIMHANAERLPDGRYRHHPEDLVVSTRLRPDVAQRFCRMVAEDQENLSGQ